MQSTSVPLFDMQRYISYTGTMLQLICALMLALVFWITLRQTRRQRYVTAWSWAWVALALAIIAVVVRYNIMTDHGYSLAEDSRLLVQFLYASYHASKLLFYALLCAGCLHYVRGGLPVWYLPLVALGGTALVIITTQAATDLDQFVSLQAPVAVLSSLACASLMSRLPHSRRSTASLALALVFLVIAAQWALYFVAFGVTAPLVTQYPLPYIFEQLVRYNSFFDAGANIALGFGTLLLLQDDARREVDSVYGELAIGLDPRRRSALHDSVTGSMNQRAFQKGLGLDAARATVGTVVALDIDRLKSINDGHGHAAGDALLRYLVEVLRGALRVSDKLYRWGGDEFLLVLPHAQPARVKQRLRELLDDSPDLYLSPVQSIKLNVTIGVADYAGAEDLNAAIERANIDQQREKLQRRPASPSLLTPAN